MENIDFATLFQGIGTMMASGWVLASARVFLVLLGLLLIYLGWKGILEPMVMIQMGLGMLALNCGTLLNEYYADRFPATCLYPDV